MSRTQLQYNYTSNNIPGAYYGLLPELPRVNIAVPNGTIELSFNTTGDQADLQPDSRLRWDFLYTIYFNRPDSESVYPSPSGYQFSETLYFGHAVSPGNITFRSDGPVYYNDTTYLFAPGDSLVHQLIELEEDGSTPTGRRFFGPNITVVRNETAPITTTMALSDIPFFTRTTRSIDSTSSRPPPASTYPWTAEAAITTSASGTPAQTSAPANAGSRSVKRSMLQVGTALLLISAAVAAL